MASSATATATAAASLRLSSVSHPAAASSSSSPAMGSTNNDGEFITFKATMRLPISPRFAASNHPSAYPGHDQGMDGVREVLAAWVMRYLPPLRAVLLSFSPTPRFLHPAASFPASASPFDSSFAAPPHDPRSLLSSPQPHARDGGDDEEETVRFKSLPMVQGTGFTLANVEWEGVGWRPRVGMKLLGTLTLSSPSHVSLLLHNLFNASIPSSHLPTDQWEFDPDCAVPPIVLERRNAHVPLQGAVEGVRRTAEEETEARAGGGGDGLVAEGEEAEADEAVAEEDDDQAAEAEAEEEEDEALYAERGWWVHRTSREPLGGSDGRIEFTLVDLTTTNSLLSCTGSLLSDPFSPDALAALSAHRPSSADATLVKTKVLTTHAQAQHRANTRRKRARDSESDSGSDSDSSASPAPAHGRGVRDDDESSDDGVDHDDDDGVGTGIPRHGVDAGAGAGGGTGVPRVGRALSTASSRSPTPGEGGRGRGRGREDAPEVEDVKPGKEKGVKKEKKEKKERKDRGEGRKSKKVKAER